MRTLTLLNTFFAAVTLASTVQVANAQQANLQSLLESLPITVRQLVVVTADAWGSRDGVLLRLEKLNDGWHQDGNPVRVVFGRNGLAWGRGLQPDGLSGPEKREGDLKSPAGVFQLGPAFGYAGSPVLRTKLPYKPSTDRDYFVDDAASGEYNTWVTIAASEPNSPESRWRSFERMRRGDGLYEYGVVVQQNTNPVMPGKGSAIFLHIWRGRSTTTAGCTAMSKDDLIRLVEWLDPAQLPLLIQAPSSALALLSAVRKPLGASR